MEKPNKTLEQLVAQEEAMDLEFHLEWLRLAPAREFATALLRHRADHCLSQRDLAGLLGVSQPRIAKLESGEHNPNLNTIIEAVRILGIEFVLDVLPADRTSTFVKPETAEASSITHGDVTVIAASN